MIFDVPTLERVSVDELEALGIGAGILGTGGGGHPRVGKLRIQTLLEDEAYPDSVEVIQPNDLKSGATVASVGGMGAPTIGVEKLPNGGEELRALEAIEQFSGREVEALIPGEIGGVNSIVPLCVAAMTDLPVLDADGMGRAFPELQMDTFFIYGHPVNYAAISDEHGNVISYQDIDTAKRLEKFARSAAVDMGGRAGYAFPLMNGDFVTEYSIQRTLSLINTLGQHVLEAQSSGRDPVEVICNVVGGQHLFTGKIVDVLRRNEAGFARGTVELAGLDDDATLTIEFQNEFLVARKTDDEVLVSVPDLICLVDKNTGKPITTDALRYGQRVTVLGVPAPELLTTGAALDVVGPEPFGYNIEYSPLSEK